MKSGRAARVKGELGTLTLHVPGSRSGARAGCLTAMGFRALDTCIELALVARFGEQLVTVNVQVGHEHARQLGLAA